MDRFKKSKAVTKRFIPLLFIVAAVVFFALIHALFSGSTEVVKTIFPGLIGLKSTDNKINVLLLGLAGGRHDGADLTDTIMVASYNLKENRLYLISIPRDLWVPTHRSKVNAIYKSGLNLSKTIMGNIVGLPINYAVRLDFNGFIRAVDTLGGIDIYIDKSFDDYLYPIAGKENDLCGNQYQDKVLLTSDGQIATDSAEPEKGYVYFKCRYERLHFETGLAHMNGTTALKFVRSRYGTNGEGSDFARAKRQQKVIEAAKEKVLSLDTLANPAKLSELISTLAQSIDTDIKVSDILEFYKLSRDIKKTETVVLDDKLLYNPPSDQYGGAYVLVSQDDDFSTIQRYIMQIMSQEVKGEASASARTSNN